MTAADLKPLTTAELDALSAELKQALMALYGPRFDRLILYGSYARGDFHAESDVDYLVVLTDDEVAYGREVTRISKPAGQLSVHYLVSVSPKPVARQQYLTSDRLFFRTVRREGITL